MRRYTTRSKYTYYRRPRLPRHKPLLECLHKSALTNLHVSVRDPSINVDIQICNKKHASSGSAFFVAGVRFVALTAPIVASHRWR